jgi:hypothetical protein
MNVQIKGSGYPVDWKVFVNGEDQTKDLTLYGIDLRMDMNGHYVILRHHDGKSSWVRIINNPTVELVTTDEFGNTISATQFPCEYYAEPTS